MRGRGHALGNVDNGVVISHVKDDAKTPYWVIRVLISLNHLANRSDLPKKIKGYSQCLPTITLVF